MSFASTCSLNLGLCLQSEELKHSQLLSSPGLTYSRCFWKPLLKGTLKTCKAELLNKSICEGENQFPKTWWIAELRVVNRFELHVAVAFFWWCILPFILCIWKGNSPQISCVGDSRAGQGSEHRLSPLFRLSLGSVTCCGKEWCVTQGVNSWTAAILCGYQCSSFFSVRKLVVSITRCVPAPADAEPGAPQPSVRFLLQLEGEFPQHSWIFTTPEKLFH